jgi:hypothetical protein
MFRFIMLSCLAGIKIMGLVAVSTGQFWYSWWL